MADLCGADLIDLVEANNASFCRGDIIVGSGQEALHAYFGVFTDVTGLSEGGTIGHAKGDSKNAGKSLRHQGFADAGRTEEQDVGFFQCERC